MNSSTSWRAAAVIFLAAGLLSLVTGRTAIALLLIAAAVASYAVPDYLTRRKR